ncbi:MAG TPA: FAD-dependent monooxygenase [Terriglobales bacterium]|nr:FAD-dependent monooxygenase [Terriglobales bacterium]
MGNNDVLISGAGIAGPALAYWLRAAGFDPTVVERAPAPRPGGQAVDLRGAGRTVTERMGLLDRVREVALEQEGFAYVDTRGRITARMPADAFGGEGIVSEIEVLRGDLCRVLYEASLPATEYLFDDTITRLDQDAGGVTVAFERAPTRRFALVVGADGLHSTVRRLAFGPDSSCLRPLALYNAWYTAPADIDLGGWFLMYNAPGGLVASARPGRDGGEIKASLSFRAEDDRYERIGRAAQQEELERRFADAGWEVPRLLDAMGRADDFYFDSVGQVHLPEWSRGRVVLLGDAGYCPSPLSGLGTSLALVGAYVLVAELVAAGGDHRIAFPRYQERLRAYVAQAMQLPPGGVGGFAPMSDLMIRMRALSMRWVTRWPMRALVAGQFTKADAIELPPFPGRAAGPLPVAT